MRAAPAAFFVAIALPCTIARGEDTVYRHAAVAADHAIASEAGLEMLRRGGNAVDAAVAASFCLSVVRPYSCGLGGGGFMLIYAPAVESRGEIAAAIDYRETAPAAVGHDYFERLGDAAASHTGPHAAGVPGTVAGLLWALDHYGTLDRATVLQPAIRTAEDGFAVDLNHVEAAVEAGKRLDRHPQVRPEAALIWETWCRGGEIRAGDVVHNPGQARALRLISRHGADAFYRGEIAAAIVEAMRTGGGPITAEDLAGYTVRLRQPLRGSFRGLEVLAMPPPSSGGITMLQILGMVERRLGEIDLSGRSSPLWIHLVTEAMKHAFADRAAWLADPQYAEVPVDRLLSAPYLDRRAAAISLARTSPAAHYGAAPPPNDDGGTSHVSVVDASGMGVACTETINLHFGSLVVVPGFGFALNDEMDDFTTRTGANHFGLTQSARNAPEPGKRPLSSMSPTIVLDGGRPILVAGASGGPLIISATVECLLDCLVFDRTPGEAVRAPRFHHQWLPDELEFETRWDDETVIESMCAMGHATVRSTRYASVQLIRIGPGGIEAACDPRKGGSPAGY